MIKNFFETTESDYKEIKIKSNYHSHNYLCGHAKGTVTNYVNIAVDNGLTTIGISDHCKTPVVNFTPYMDDRILIEKYLPQFEEAKKIYGNKIDIRKGVEIEYFDGHDDYYEGLLKNLDYMIMGMHYYLINGVVKSTFFDKANDENFDAYCQSVIHGIKSGFFYMVAHPDLIFITQPTLTNSMKNSFEEVVKQAVKHDVLLELNANGIRSNRFMYPTDLLIELCKKYNARIAISSDNHQPNLLCDEYTKRLYSYAKQEKLNLQY